MVIGPLRALAVTVGAGVGWIPRLPFWARAIDGKTDTAITRPHHDFIEEPFIELLSSGAYRTRERATPLTRD
jgi:hypothetical protein